MDFCMFHYFISRNTMNDLNIIALHVYYYKYLLNILSLRNGFICLIQIKLYFHQMQNSLFKGRIIGNKVEEEFYVISLFYEVFLSLESHSSWI